MQKIRAPVAVCTVARARWFHACAVRKPYGTFDLLCTALAEVDIIASTLLQAALCQRAVLARCPETSSTTAGPISLSFVVSYPRNPRALFYDMLLVAVSGCSEPLPKVGGSGWYYE